MLKMSKNIQNYFTTGELSQLCKIPRKTLLYYDKLGLITPELVDENGYRYYKRSQLFLLQLILTLRQLDVPIARIKDYLAKDVTVLRVEDRPNDLILRFGGMDEIVVVDGFVDVVHPILHARDLRGH